MFKFVYTNDSGNNMFIDDINLTGVVGQEEILDQLLQRVYSLSSASASLQDSQAATIARAVNHVLLYRMMELLRDEEVSNQIKAQVSLALHDLRASLTIELARSIDTQWRANHQLALDEINNWLNGGSDGMRLSAPLPMPPGAPI